VRIADPLLIISVALALLISLAFHEASHAFASDKLGDPTARSLGRLTLNPLAHLDPVGTIAMVLSSLAGFGIGWGKPVPVYPQFFRNGPLAKLPNADLVGMALVALAGPVSNLLLATVGAILLSGVSDPTSTSDIRLNRFLLTFVVVNVRLAVFNMIPVPPLDGYRVLLGILPAKPAYQLARLEQYGVGILMLLIFIGQPILFRVLVFFSTPIFRALTGTA